MTVPLTSNFFAHARGFIFKDGGGVTWSFNKNTNELTATAAGGAGVGTVTSVGLALPAIFVVSGSPVTTTGTLTGTLATQAANLVFAGPGSGGVLAPTFRALVLADIPTITAAHTSGFAAVATSGSYLDVSGLSTVAHTGAYADLSGTPSIPTGANPSGLIGMAAVNGVAGTWLRSDGLHAIDPAIAPTWTGAWTFTPSGANPTVTFNKGSTSPTLQFNSPAATQVTPLSFLQTGQTQWQIYQPASSNDFRIYSFSRGDTIIINKDGGVLFNGAGAGDVVTISAGAANSLVVGGISAGTAVVRFNTQVTTGTATPTLGTVKPGANTAASKWLPVSIDGTTMYIPCWL